MRPWRSKYATWAWQLLGVLALGLGTPAGLSQCEEAGSLPAVPRPPQKEVQNVFRFIQGDLTHTKPTVRAVKVDSLEVDTSLLIVPGERVGKSRLGVSLKSLLAQGALESGEKVKDEAYEYILPLGYVPQRYRTKAKKGDLTYSFTSDETQLKEIEVVDPTYKTGDGLGVGVDQALVEKRVAGCEQRRSKKSLTYQVCEGITFVIKDKKVLRIVVFEKTGARVSQ